MDKNKIKLIGFHEFVYRCKSRNRMFHSIHIWRAPMYDIDDITTVVGNNFCGIKNTNLIEILNGLIN